MSGAELAKIRRELKLFVEQPEQSEYADRIMRSFSQDLAPQARARYLASGRGAMYLEAPLEGSSVSGQYWWSLESLIGVAEGPDDDITQVVALVNQYDPEREAVVFVQNPDPEPGRIDGRGMIVPMTVNDPDEGWDSLYWQEWLECLFERQRRIMDAESHEQRLER